MKHNKKRNTAFIYEALIKEFTKAVLQNDTANKVAILDIFKEHFITGAPLLADLRLYRVLLETKNMQATVAERLLQETKEARLALDDETIFDAQSRVIAAINKSLGQHVWSNFVPNFKTLASIKSIFTKGSPVKQRVLFEQALVDQMASKRSHQETALKSIDNITYHSFINKFNEKYTNLLEEQKDFLNRYITSFADEGFELRVYLNEEIVRLKSLISKVVESETADTLIRQKSTDVVGYLDSLRRREFEGADLTKLLKTQELVRELAEND